MTYSLRIMQGRLAEVIGDRPKAGGRETALDNDRKMRTFGWARAAARTAANLDPGTTRLLEAYCEGVNNSFSAQQKAGTLHPLFKQLEVTPEPWTPADCLLSWWHLAQYFAGDGTRELHGLAEPDPAASGPATASATKDALGGRRRGGGSAGGRQRGLAAERRRSSARARAGGTSGTATDAPKFSHAWVVGGSKTTTGSPCW